MTSYLRTKITANWSCCCLNDTLNSELVKAIELLPMNCICLNENNNSKSERLNLISKINAHNLGSENVQPNAVLIISKLHLHTPNIEISNSHLITQNLITKCYEFIASGMKFAKILATHFMRLHVLDLLWSEKCVCLRDKVVVGSWFVCLMLVVVWVSWNRCAIAITLSQAFCFPILWTFFVVVVIVAVIYYRLNEI